MDTLFINQGLVPIGLQILGYLDPITLANCRLVNRTWCGLISEERFWALALIELLKFKTNPRNRKIVRKSNWTCPTYTHQLKSLDPRNPRSIAFNGIVHIFVVFLNASINRASTDLFPSLSFAIYCSFTPPKSQFYDGFFYQVVLWFSRGLSGT